MVVTASFGCPTIVANQGQPIATGESLIAIESLRKEWFAINPSQVAAAAAAWRAEAIDTRSGHVFRRAWLAMLKRDSADIRDNLRRIAATIDDLTRSRVLALADADFAQYIALTVPHAVTTKPARAGLAQVRARITRLLQYGFLFTVTAVRAELEHPGQSPMAFARCGVCNCWRTSTGSRRRLRSRQRQGLEARSAWISTTRRFGRSSSTTCARRSKRSALTTVRSSTSSRSRCRT